MRPFLRVMTQVSVEHSLEMPEPVRSGRGRGTLSGQSTLTARRRHSLAAPGSAWDDPHPFRLEHGVEGTRELGVPVVQEEPNAGKPVLGAGGGESWGCARTRCLRSHQGGGHLLQPGPLSARLEDPGRSKGRGEGPWMKPACPHLGAKWERVTLPRAETDSLTYPLTRASTL
jgi:hypothetical protein